MIGRDARAVLATVLGAKPSAAYVGWHAYRIERAEVVNAFDEPQPIDLAGWVLFERRPLHSVVLWRNQVILYLGAREGEA